MSGVCCLPRAVNKTCNAELPSVRVLLLVESVCLAERLSVDFQLLKLKALVGAFYKEMVLEVTLSGHCAVPLTDLHSVNLHMYLQQAIYSACSGWLIIFVNILIPIIIICLWQNQQRALIFAHSSPFFLDFILFLK